MTEDQILGPAVLIVRAHANMVRVRLAQGHNSSDYDAARNAYDAELSAAEGRLKAERDAVLEEAAIAAETYASRNPYPEMSRTISGTSRGIARRIRALKADSPTCERPHNVTEDQ